MKIINKLSILVLLCSVMVACNNKKPGPEPTNPSNNNNDETEVIDPTAVTTPLDPFDICCDSGDLDNPDSLLSKRLIMFAYDQATVESEYRDIISIHARYLSQNPSAQMVLEGHADERGTPEYNLALGEKRGNSVANLLRAQGASAAQLSVVSFGEEKPVSMCNDDSCWSQNRRVRIVYTSK